MGSTRICRGSWWAACGVMAAVQGGGGHQHNSMLPSSMAMQPVNGVKSEHQQHYQHPQRVRLDAQCLSPGCWEPGALLGFAAHAPTCGNCSAGSLLRSSLGRRQTFDRFDELCAS